jgi:hypothetical protein
MNRTRAAYAVAATLMDFLKELSFADMMDENLYYADRVQAMLDWSHAQMGDPTFSDMVRWKAPVKGATP